MGPWRCGEGVEWWDFRYVNPPGPTPYIHPLPYPHQPFLLPSLHSIRPNTIPKVTKANKTEKPAVDTFTSSLLSLPPDPDIIAEGIHANSTTLDSRRFAEEFVRRRKLADQGKLVADSGGAGGFGFNFGAGGGGSGAGAGGGWSSVAGGRGNRDRARDAERDAEGSGNAGEGRGEGGGKKEGFQVVGGRKRGKR